MLAGSSIFQKNKEKQIQKTAEYISYVLKPEI